MKKKIFEWETCHNAGIDQGPGFSSTQEYHSCPGPSPARAEVLLTAVVTLTLCANDAKIMCVSHNVCMLTLAWHMVLTA